MNNQTSHRRSIVSEIDWGKLGAIIAAILGVVLIGFGAYYFIKSYFELKAFKDQRDVERFKKMISAHMELPPGDPIIASVKDVDKLKRDQPFYKNARNGDIVYIWKDKAVLYRPGEDRIVDFGVIVPKKSAAPSPAAEKTLNVTIVNAGAKEEAFKQVKNMLNTEQIPGNNLALGIISSKEKFKESMVIDVSGQNTGVASKIATDLGFSLQQSLPEGMKVDANTDIVVITKAE